MRAGEIAVALFEAEDIPVFLARRFEHADLLADELEAREDPAKLHAVVLCHSVYHVGRDNRCDRNRLLRHLAACETAFADIVQQNDPHLVAGNKPVAALMVGHGSAAAVAVRVGAEEQIRLNLLAQLESFLHRLPDFGVRIRAGREIAVGLFLLGNDGHVLHAELFCQHPDALEPRAVERRIDELELFDALSAAHALGVDCVDKRLQAAVWNFDDFARALCLVEVHVFRTRKIVERLNDRQHRVRRLGSDLAAVRAVDLVAVILRGVVACRHVDARAAAVIAHGKAQRRRRLQSRVEIDRHAVCRKDLRRHFGKERAAHAAVVGDGNLLRKTGSGKPGRQTLRGTRHGVDVHPVRARTEHAAQSRRAEGEVAAEAVENFLCVALHGGKLFGKRRVQTRLAAPGLIPLHCKAHTNASCFSFSY